MENDEFYMKDGKYTTCDNHEHPHFYLQLTQAKVRPKKNIVTGPAYMVLADVPLPLAIPFGFFPFTEKYSSGIIMPTFGDELARGYYLRDGGCYFFVLLCHQRLRRPGSHGRNLHQRLVGCQCQVGLYQAIQILG